MSYVGKPVADRRGERIGECVAEISHGADPRWLVVRTDWKRQQRVVPTRGAQERDGTVLVPWPLVVVMAAPQVDATSKGLSRAAAARLRRFYIGPEEIELPAPEATQPEATQPEATQPEAAQQEAAPDAEQAGQRAETPTPLEPPNAQASSQGAARPLVIAGSAGGALILGAVGQLALRRRQQRRRRRPLLRR